MRQVIDVGIQRTKDALNLLKISIDRIPLIHVAGTNGKGSVVVLLKAALETKYRVGVFTSPFLRHPTDAIKVPDGFSVPDLARDTRQRLQELKDTDHGNVDLTEFEFWTVCAFASFEKAAVDVGIVEVGLGGRDDATNVIENPLLSIITSIGFDHQNILGNSIAEIAQHKSGIIKVGCPVLVAPQRWEEVDRIFAKEATRKRSKITWAKSCNSADMSTASEHITKASQNLRAIPPPDYEPALFEPFEFQLGLVGDHQQQNSGVAVTALAILQNHFNDLDPLPDLVRWTFPSVRHPGRMSWQRRNDLDCLIDGSHNAAGAQMLAKYIKKLREGYPRPIQWVIGFSAQKDVEAYLDELQMAVDPAVDTLFPTEFTPPAGMGWVKPKDADILRKHIQGRDWRCAEHYGAEQVGTLLDRIKVQMGDQEPIVVVCGSLYLASDFYRLFEDK